MTQHYRHLGPFSDLVAAASRAHALFPRGLAPAEIRRRVRALLAFGDDPPAPLEVRSGRRWESDGVIGEEVGWLVGYGPRTAAWVLRPAGVGRSSRRGWRASRTGRSSLPARAAMPLMVQYALADELFTVDGMRAADARIGALYQRAGARDHYRGEFHPGPHRFDRAMQAAAFDWLRDRLAEEFEP